MSQTSEERKEILQLLAEGKITATEAADLLSTVKPVAAEPPDPGQVKINLDEDLAVSKATAGGLNGPSWFHVRVNDTRTGKTKVTVNIPLRLVRQGLAIGRRYVPEFEGFDWQDFDALLSQEKGVLIDVQDEEDGEHVQIYVD